MAAGIPVVASEVEGIPDQIRHNSEGLLVPPDDTARREQPTVDLAVFVGLQASGKSTLFREWFAASHAHVSKDYFSNHRNRARKSK